MALTSLYEVAAKINIEIQAKVFKVGKAIYIIHFLKGKVFDDFNYEHELKGK